MEFLIILACMFGYAVLALIFVFIVRKITKLKLFRSLAVAFVILLPTWDVVLGYLVYYPACMFIPKVAIYDTAETEGIYFEGINDYVFKLDRSYRNEADEELTNVGSISYDFAKGYAFAEAKVTKESISYTEDRKIAPVIYRCIPLPKDESRPAFQRTSCFIVNDVKSRYMVKVKSIRIATAEINFKKIIDRSTGKLIAEYNRVYFSGFSPPIPFFNWYYKLDGSGIGYLECPHVLNNFDNFEYKVLKPRK